MKSFLSVALAALTLAPLHVSAYPGAACMTETITKHETVTQTKTVPGIDINIPCLPTTKTVTAHEPASTVTVTKDGAPVTKYETKYETKTITNEGVPVTKYETKYETKYVTKYETKYETKTVTNEGVPVTKYETKTVTVTKGGINLTVTITKGGATVTKTAEKECHPVTKYETKYKTVTKDCH